MKKDDYSDKLLKVLESDDDDDGGGIIEVENECNQEHNFDRVSSSTNRVLVRNKSAVSTDNSIEVTNVDQ